MVGISLRKSETSGVVTLSGPVGLDQLRVMHDYVDLLLTNRVTAIYFDFSGVDRMSISAIGALSDIRDRVDDHGGRLYLAGLHGVLNPLVDLDHLRRFFTVFEGPLPDGEAADADRTAPADEQSSGDAVPEDLLAGDPADTGGAAAEAD